MRRLSGDLSELASRGQIFTVSLLEKTGFGDVSAFLPCRPRSVTHIVYTTQVPVAWQRVICAKELVHIFDRKAEKTDTPDEVSELIEKILGPLSTEDYGFADLQAAADRLALYQCLPLLFPTAALGQAKAAIDSGEMTVEQVAEAACIPLGFVRLILSDDWEKLNGFLCEK